jgi:hypothetical protein
VLVRSNRSGKRIEVCGHRDVFAIPDSQRWQWSIYESKLASAAKRTVFAVSAVALSPQTCEGSECEMGISRVERSAGGFFALGPEQVTG